MKLSKCFNHHRLMASCLANYTTTNKPTETTKEAAKKAAGMVEIAIGSLILPKPYATKSVRKESKLVEWPEGKQPVDPEDFIVTKFAGGFENARSTYIPLSGDLLVDDDAGYVN